MTFVKPKLHFNNVLRDSQTGNDGTAYATCAEAVEDIDDPYKVRGNILPATDVPDLATLEGSGIVFDTTGNEYRIVDSEALIRRIQGLGLLPTASNFRSSLVVGSYLYLGCGTSPGIIAKIDLTTSPLTVVKTLILNSGENIVSSLAIYGTDLYAGCGTKIIKIALGNFTRTSALSISSGDAIALAVYGTDLYVGCATYTPAKIIKVDLLSFTETSALTLSTGEGYVYCLAVYGTDIYAGCAAATVPGIVVKISLLTFTRTTALTLNAGENNVFALIVYGTDLYAACPTSAAIIVKISLGTFTRTSAITLSSGENNPRAMVVYGTDLYVGCYVSPSIIVKISLLTFTRTTALTLTGYNTGWPLAVYGTKLYVGCYLSPGICVKVDFTAFTVDSALTFGVGETTAYACILKDQYLYMGCYVSPGVVVKVDLSSMTRVGYVQLSAGENLITAMAIYGDNLFVSCYLSATKIVKIDLVSFTRSAVITLSAGENLALSMVVQGSDLYIGCETSAAIIVKVSCLSFTRTGAITLSAGENTARALSVSGTSLYVGCNLSPAKIVKVNLLTFLRDSVLTLNANENLPACMIVSGTDLYVGCATTAAIIVKVSISGAMSRTGAVTLSTGENNAYAMAVHGNNLLVACYVSPGIIVKIYIPTFARISSLTMSDVETTPRALIAYGNFVYAVTETSPAYVVEIDPYPNFTLFERLQEADIGDSFTVRAGLVGKNEDLERPILYAADGHRSPRAKGLTNTALYLRAHAPNFIKDGGFESGAFLPNWVAGANWSIVTANKLEGAYSASYDLAATNHLQQYMIEKLVKGKTYRILFKAKSLTANPQAAVLTVQAKQSGTNTDIDAMTGTQPTITTTATWFEIDMTPDFETDNWYLKFLMDSTKKGSATAFIVDEVYIYEKKTINSLVLGYHNLVGVSGVIVNAWRLSPLRSTASADAANKTEIGNFNVDTAGVLLQSLTTSYYPVVEVIIPAVASWIAEIGELYVGDYWQIPSFIQGPLDPRRVNADGLVEVTYSIKNMNPALRTSTIKDLFAKLQDAESMFVTWDTDDPILMESPRDVREAVYNPYLLDMNIKLLERL